MVVSGLIKSRGLDYSLAELFRARRSFEHHLSLFVFELSISSSNALLLNIRTTVMWISKLCSRSSRLLLGVSYLHPPPSAFTSPLAPPA